MYRCQYCKIDEYYGWVELMLRLGLVVTAAYQLLVMSCVLNADSGRYADTPVRAGFKCVKALGRIIIRGPYPSSNAIIYMHIQL